MTWLDPLPVPPAALVLGVAGVLAGAAARLLLARLRRGARVRAPVCEIAVGVAWAACGAGWMAGAVPPAWVPALLALCWLAVAAGATDLVHHRLPDALTLPALPVFLALLVPVGADAVARGAAGAVLAAAVHAAAHLVAPRAMGAGDVKLAAPLGALLAAAAWAAPVLAAVLAAVLTGVAALLGVAVARARGRPRSAAVAHGPSMLAATAVVLLATITSASTA